MPEHLITDEIESYLKREMKPAELLRADDHLAQCEACFQKVKNSDIAESAADLGYLPDFFEETEHLSYEELERYADDKTGEAQRENADAHLRICEDCRAELNGLKEMRRLIEADLQKPVSTENRRETSIFAPLGNLFSGGSFLKISFAAAALAIFAAALFLISKRDSSAPEIAQKTPPPQSVNSQPSQTSAPTENSPVNVETNAPPNANANLPDQSPVEKKTNEFPPAYRAEIERALAANRLSLPAELSQLGGQKGTLMGGGSESVPFALEAPLGKIIQTARPQFRWRALDGATGYVVSVYDTDFNRVAGSPQISGTSWQLARPLARDRIYIWQVTALKDGQEIKSPVRPAPDARFKVVDAGKANELTRLSREYKNEHLALGILYANAGLLTEAAREFQKELAKNPNSKQAREFLRQVRRQK